MEELCPASTSLLDGFGARCHLGANSMGTRWALHGRELQRAASKSRSSWQSSERPVRREGGSRVIAYRFLHEVEMTWRKVEKTKAGLGIKRRERIAYALYRACVSLIPSSHPPRIKWGLSGCFPAIFRHFHGFLERLNSRLIPSCTPVDITKVGANRDLGLKSPISRGVRLVAIKIFFCVCLAHARQWGIRHPHCHRRGLYSVL